MRIAKIHLKNIGVFEDETIEFKEKTNSGLNNYNFRFLFN